MIGALLSDEFFVNRDWPVARAVAIAMLLLLVVPIMLFQHFQNNELEAREAMKRRSGCSADACWRSASRSSTCRSCR